MCIQLTTSCMNDMQNIDTDQIIPAEYLTLVPSKVRDGSLRSQRIVACIAPELVVHIHYHGIQPTIPIKFYQYLPYSLSDRSFRTVFGLIVLRVLLSACQYQQARHLLTLPGHNCSALHSAMEPLGFCCSITQAAYCVVSMLQRPPDFLVETQTCTQNNTSQC
jgi:hypothetical protein